MINLYITNKNVLKINNGGSLCQNCQVIHQQKEKKIRKRKKNQ